MQRQQCEGLISNISVQYFDLIAPDMAQIILHKDILLHQ